MFLCWMRSWSWTEISSSKYHEGDRTYVVVVVVVVVGGGGTSLLDVELGVLEAVVVVVVLWQSQCASILCPEGTYVVVVVSGALELLELLELSVDEDVVVLRQSQHIHTSLDSSTYVVVVVVISGTLELLETSVDEDVVVL